MTGLNFDSKMGQVAREIERAASNGRDVDFDYLQERLGQRFSRKEIADCASSLYKRGYLERLGHGKYKASQKLSQLAGRADPANSAEGHTEDSGQAAPVIVRKKGREKPEEEAQHKHENDLAPLGDLLDRLESCLDRLEKIAESLNSRAELQEVMELLQKAVAKGKKLP
ncbi:MAG: hypothetical protein R6U22_12165 [Desulfohalobiaceae bacterium]